MKLLLHVCCGPCLIYPYRELAREGFEVEGYFYNPNIHPLAEHRKRQEAVEAISKDLNIKTNYFEYNFEQFFLAIGKDTESPQRCKKCWELRLKNTAEFAKENNYENFSTTLLVSPYQDLEAIQTIGDKIAEEVGVNFIFRDFRIGFRQAHNEAKDKEIYCQKYCGCLFSERERYNKR